VSAHPVVEVTVQEDRAFVRREGRLSPGAGRHVVRIDDVAPVLVDKTLVAEVSDGRVLEVRALRQLVHRDEDRSDRYASILEARRAAEREIRELKERLERASRELGDLETTTKLLCEEIGRDVGWGRSDVESWERSLATLQHQEETLRVESAALHGELADAERRQAYLTAQQRSAATPADAVRCRIEVELEIPEGEVVLRVGYLVPNACWRPRHRAHLKDDGTLRFETEACVWQRTGEDWSDVALFVSTERSSAGAEPPRLATDVLYVQPKREVVEVEAREQQVQTLGLGRKKKEAPEVPGVDDGGEPLRLQALHRANVPTDGRPHRTALRVFETEAVVGLVAMPELASAVLVRSRQANAGEEPILAGPVELVRESGPVGRTSVLYVAPGERFELGWGPDSAVRVRRESKRLDEKSKMLSSWVRVPHRVDLKLSNLSTETKHVEVVERVPVSEVEQVKIELDREETTAARVPDEDGFVRWQLDLGGGSHEALRLAYDLVRKSDVVGV